MAISNSYGIQLASDAARQFKKLDAADRDRVRAALIRHARRCADGDGARGGKSLKQIQGRRDRFFRLRIGEYRVLFDVLDSDHTLLVLGIVNRRDLERWLRGR